METNLSVANRLPKAVPRKCNISMANGHANRLNTFAFVSKVFVPEQCGPAFPYAAIKTSHGASVLAPGNVVISEEVQLNPTRELDPMFVNQLMHFLRNECAAVARSATSKLASWNWGAAM